jgi:hypothetical protein
MLDHRFLADAEDLADLPIGLAPRDRYGVTKRALLAIRALFDGQISFADVFGR